MERKINEEAGRQKQKNNGHVSKKERYFIPRNIFQLHNDFEEDHTLKKIGITQDFLDVIFICVSKSSFSVYRSTGSCLSILPVFGLPYGLFYEDSRMGIWLSSKVQSIQLITFYLFHLLMYCLYTTCLLKILPPEFGGQDKEKRLSILKLVLLLCFFTQRHYEFSQAFLHISRATIIILPAF